MAEVETTIDSIRVTRASPECTVILKQEGAQNYLPIWLSQCQADIVKSELAEPTKSTAPDLFLANINATDSNVKSVSIHLENNAFYAKLLLSQHDQPSELRCPIGTALTLAYRVEAPMLVEEALFDQVGVTLPPYLPPATPKGQWWRRLFKRHKPYVSRVTSK